MIYDHIPALAAPVTSLRGMGPKRAALLEKLGVETVGDLLLHFPRRHEDHRVRTAIADLAEGVDVTLEGTVTEMDVRPSRRQPVTTAVIEDASGSVGAVWFGRRGLARQLPPGVAAVFAGRVGRYRDELVLQNPDFALSGNGAEAEFSGLRPVYPTVDGLSQRQLRGFIAAAFETLDGTPCQGLTPADLEARHGWPPAGEALRAIHWPDAPEAAEHARARFAYEEFLALQAAVLWGRAGRRSGAGVAHNTQGPLLEALRISLPFTLTPGQQRAVDAILADMAAPAPMMRLLQGDVGSGKTAVALHAIAAALDSGRQAALMAPTEALADQHALTIKKTLETLGARVALLTGSAPGGAAVRRAVADGQVNVIVGTQALIQDTVDFESLGLVIVDEQHRFGVAQRARLGAKGPAPDLLHMTATPIPRSLTLTLYGGMDLTVIPDLPPGRLPVKTARAPAHKEEDLHRYIVEQAQAGKQTYYVCPLIEESDVRDLGAVTERYESLTRGPLRSVPAALLHGRMASAVKEETLRAFREGRISVLFSTSVVEVGIDAPGAAIMVIEDAASFGLSQLHQLRGRVGRSDRQAYCFLLGTPATEEGKERLDALCRHHSGFDIAEADLRLRGPGEFAGVRQTGLTGFRAADLVRDAELLETARQDAREILARDPGLREPGHARLREAAERLAAFNP